MIVHKDKDNEKDTDKNTDKDNNGVIVEQDADRWWREPKCQLIPSD